MTEVPRFFSIIERKVLQRNKIQIPKKIVRKCGDSLTEQACFKLPFGLDWKIGLTKSSDGKVWIDKGWPEFSKHYSIAFGHFLVFGYQGNSQFQVAIFDDHTIEIDYKSFSKDDKCTTKARKRPRSPPRTSSHRSHGKLDSLDDQSESEKSVNYWTSRRDKKSKALQKMTGFKSNRPFFIREIQPTNVEPRCFQLIITRNFAKSHLGIGMKPVILKVVERKNKSWSVNYNLKGSNKARFGDGWKAFARDNAIKIGDICAFAMIKTIKSIVFEVTIYREIGSTDFTSLPGMGSKKPKLVRPKRSLSTRNAKMPLLIKSTAKEEPEELLVEKDDSSCEVERSSRASEVANKLKFCSKHPLFQVDFQSSCNAVHKLSIPSWFARSYLEAKTQVASLRVGERSWDVKILCYHSTRYPTVAFSRGWSTFVNDNSLRPRDLGIFELVKRDQAVFQVSIFRDQV